MSALPWLEPAWLAFSKRRAQLPHAILLSALPGCGLDQLLASVAASILCTHVASDGYACEKCRSCLALQSHTHPDFYKLSPPDGKVSIGIDDVREVCERLSRTALAGGYQLAVIDPAHAMTTAAANALLKTLEEPSPGTVVILLSEHPGKLLPTLLSRCQRIHVNRPSSEQAKSWLNEALSLSEKDSANLLALASGSPMLAAELHQQKALGMYAQLSSLLKAPDPTSQLSFAKASEPRTFAIVYEKLLLAQTRAALNRGVSHKMMIDLGKQRDKLLKVREWQGTGVRMDLAIAELLAQHPNPSSTSSI